MYISSLMIELTRTCNLICDHCIRGESEKGKVNAEHLSAFIKNLNITSIGTLMFTGGEPSLNPEGIDSALDILVQKGVSFENWWISTNGVKHRKTNAFLRACARLHSLQTDGEMSGLQVSVGFYHNTDSAELKRFWNSVSEEESWYFSDSIVRKSGMHKFISEPFSISYNDYTSSTWLFGDGLAEKNGVGGQKGLYYPWESDSSVSVSFYRDEHSIGGDEPIYLSVKGDVGIGCNFSYRRFDNELKLCNVSDISGEDDFVAKIIALNSEHDAGWEIETKEDNEC